ncbi:uncharacterized protein LOC129191438 [Dunckerocampus dactyliophorus]|uniref:uncharacterized protein LOC129191438 n=1 Tax=Dunckerocampus dactyliophorus TaxID=161453 RepID=UPI0024074C47|nr:uncharacterized protein LOC129191438 [Dunckerocampus dactyliophorus]
MGPKKKLVEVELEEEPQKEGATAGEAMADLPEAVPPGSIDLTSIVCMIQKCLQSQTDLSNRWHSETQRQDERWRQMQEQVNRLSDSTSPRGEPQPPTNPPPHQQAGQAPGSPTLQEHLAKGWAQSAIPRLEDGDDIEQYLTTFERLATAYQWPQMDWAVRLIPYLTGKARAAYVAMAFEDSCNYKSVKEAILTKYEINEDVYRQRFREPDIQSGETPREFYNRLKDLYQKWMQPEKKTKEQVGEVLILEQFYHSLSLELRVWVKERNPASGREAAEFVENFLSARRGPKTFRFDRHPKSSTSQGKSVGPGMGGGPVQGGGASKPGEDNVNFSQAKPFTKGLICFSCGQGGHKKPDCPVKKTKSAHYCTVPLSEREELQVNGKRQITEVKVNGEPALALLDTGSVQTLVNASVLKGQCQFTGPGLDISCVHGDHRIYPTAIVYIEVAGQIYLLTVGVVENLAHQVILGQDIPALRELVQAGLDERQGE